MDQQRIWAPWRLDYVTHQESSLVPPLAPRAWREGAEPHCFLCRAAALYDDSHAARQQNMTVHLGAATLCLLNRYPYNNGHLLVSPLRHVAKLAELTDGEHLEAMQTLSYYTTLLSQLLSADGFNVGLNLGAAAGAGVPGHLHWHLVPRWQGDHNFMPVAAATRVIPQSLAALWEALQSQPPPSAPRCGEPSE